MRTTEIATPGQLHTTRISQGQRPPGTRPGLQANAWLEDLLAISRLRGHEILIQAGEMRLIRRLRKPVYVNRAGLSAGRVSHPWDPPEAEFPGIVPISTLHFDRSDQVAVAITGLSAYSRGFEFFVTCLIRPGTHSFDPDPVPGADGPVLAASHSFQLSLQLADGTAAISERPPGDAEPARPILQPRGGGGTAYYQHSQWWAWPLPPSGPLEFICQWPMLGINETQVAIEAQLILDAARQSVQPWSDDRM